MRLLYNVLTKHEKQYMIVEEEVNWRRKGTEVKDMASTNLNIRTDRDIKEQAEQIFNELGLSLSTAINMFLRTAIRENGIPFSLKLEEPNEITAAAIEEGRRIANDPSVRGYHSIEDLKAALES